MKISALFSLKFLKTSQNSLPVRRISISDAPGRPIAHEYFFASDAIGCSSSILNAINNSQASLCISCLHRRDETSGGERENESTPESANRRRA